MPVLKKIVAKPIQVKNATWAAENQEKVSLSFYPSIYIYLPWTYDDIIQNPKNLQEN